MNRRPVWAMTLLLCASDAAAFCGFAEQASPEAAPCETHLLVYQGTQHQWLAVQLHASVPQPRVFVIPVPSGFRASDAFSTRMSRWDLLEETSSPRVEAVVEQNPCWRALQGGSWRSGGTSQHWVSVQPPRLEPVDEFLDGTEMQPGQGFEFVLINNDVDALRTQLERFGEVPPSGFAAVARGYAAAGMKFLVVRHQAPLQFGSSHTLLLRLPLGPMRVPLGFAGLAPRTNPIRIYTFAPSVVEAANRTNRRLPPSLDLRASIPNPNLDLFYSTLHRETLRGEPTAVVTESSGAIVRCSACAPIVRLIEQIGASPEDRPQSRLQLELSSVQTTPPSTERRVQPLLQRYLPSFASCVPEEFAPAEAPNNRTTVTVIIGADGTVQTHVVREHNLSIPAIAECFAARMSRINFSPPPEGGIETVNATIIMRTTVRGGRTPPYRRLPRLFFTRMVLHAGGSVAQPDLLLREVQGGHPDFHPSYQQRIHWSDPVECAWPAYDIWHEEAFRTAHLRRGPFLPSDPLPSLSSYLADPQLPAQLAAARARSQHSTQATRTDTIAVQRSWLLCTTAPVGARRKSEWLLLVLCSLLARRQRREPENPPSA